MFIFIAVVVYAREVIIIYLRAWVRVWVCYVLHLSPFFPFFFFVRGWGGEGWGGDQFCG